MYPKYVKRFLKFVDRLAYSEDIVTVAPYDNVATLFKYGKQQFTFAVSSVRVEAKLCSNFVLLMEMTFDNFFR
jgi:hypothetical protein